LYAAGDLGAALVGNPGVAAMVEHHGMLYADLRDPIALLRHEAMASDTALGQHWPYAAGNNPSELGGADVAGYSTLMSASQPLVAADVIGAYRFDRHRSLLDLGGGEGTFLRAVATAVPNLRLKLFDLPAVAARARMRFAEAGLSGRAEAFGGDFRNDPLPNGADIISLIRVIHDHDDESAMAILRAARQALPPGGTLLIAEPMAGTAGAEPVGAYFAFYLLAMGSGRPRRFEELSDMVRQAGFGQISSLRTNQPLLVRVLVATAKP
jgi:demethylspheroidene O-methyltransferase